MAYKLYTPVGTNDQWGHASDWTGGTIPSTTTPGSLLLRANNNAFNTIYQMPYLDQATGTGTNIWALSDTPSTGTLTQYQSTLVLTNYGAVHINGTPDDKVGSSAADWRFIGVGAANATNLLVNDGLFEIVSNTSTAVTTATFLAGTSLTIAGSGAFNLIGNVSLVFGSPNATSDTPTNPTSATLTTTTGASGTGTLTFTDTALFTSPHTVTYTGSTTTTTNATNIASAINGDATLKSLGITATSAGSVATIAQTNGGLGNGLSVTASLGTVSSVAAGNGGVNALVAVGYGIDINFIATGPTGVGKHLRDIFAEGELDEKTVCAKFARTAADGKTYQVQHYNLEAILSVGYRVSSKRATA